MTSKFHRDELIHYYDETSTAFNLKIYYWHGTHILINEQLFHRSLDSALFAANTFIKTKALLPFSDTISHIVIEECLINDNGKLEHIQDIFLIPVLEEIE